MRNKMRYGLLGFFLFAAPAFAQVTPLIFERESITISSPPVPVTESDTQRIITNHLPLNFDVEIRPEDALRLEYIHTLNALTESNGVMIAFVAPSMVALPKMNVPTAVDALFIADDGQVVQMLPEVVLADLAQDIMAKTPIKAFLFLKAGTVKAKNILPKDKVSGKKFTPSPALMQ